MGELSQLKGLGPKSELSLNQIGIFTRQQLQEVGPVAAFIELKNRSAQAPSLNFLWAMVGALENRHWADIAQTERGRLLEELQGYHELQAWLYSE